MCTGSHATSLVLQLCLLRERTRLRPRVPSTLLRETVSSGCGRASFSVQNSNPLWENVRRAGQVGRLMAGKAVPQAPAHTTTQVHDLTTEGRNSPPWAATPLQK